jgi:hypothetical protein
MNHNFTLSDDYDFKIIASSYPHIGCAVDAMWGSAECRKYLFDLTIDSRGGRKGFTQNALMSIYDLIVTHDKEFPQFAQNTDKWGDNGRRPLR